MVAAQSREKAPFRAMMPSVYSPATSSAGAVVMVSVVALLVPGE